MSNSNQDFVTSVQAPSAWFKLNRPDEMNALTDNIIVGLSDFLTSTEADETIRCIILTGTGRAFCAGADLKSTAGAEALPPGEPDFYDRVEEVFNRLRNFPKPVIASLNGFTLAGGLELAMCCDLVIASEKAKIGDAHANFGVYPGAGGAAIMPRIVPRNVAKYLLFTGNMLTASEMKTYGFVNEVVASDALADATQELADHICGKSPIALRRMKEVANETQGKTAADALRHEQILFRQHLRSADMAEGLRAFQEKRTPKFQGR